MSHFANPALADKGKARIEWADIQMPVLREIRARFEKEKPLAGLNMSACLHVTCETANLARTLKAAGANLLLCASNPLSTQDDVAASLDKHYGINTHAIHGEDNTTYYKHIKAALDHNPVVTMDDGADLVTSILKDYPKLHSTIMGSMEETTTGVIRLRAMEKDKVLKFPVIAVNDARTKHLFDNRHGTGQSTIEGIMRATATLMAGKRVVVAGFGYCGRGVSARAHGLGARVIVTEVDPVRALEATMEGYDVMPMNDAAKIGDIFITVTGNKEVITGQHFKVMKDGAIVCNSGHFDVEITIPELKAQAKTVREGVRGESVDEFTMADGRRIYLLGKGRLVNLACAEGHPAMVMDMSFATQALATEWCVKNKGKLSVKVHDVPQSIDDYVATLKLKTMGITVDVLTESQKKYLASWQEGT